MKKIELVALTQLLGKISSGSISHDERKGVLGANVLEIKDALASNFPIEELPMYLVGVAVSAVVGYFAIRLVKSLSDKGKFGKFAYYCWAVGLGSLVAGIVKMMLLK